MKERTQTSTSSYFTTTFNSKAELVFSLTLVGRGYRSREQGHVYKTGEWEQLGRREGEHTTNSMVHTCRSVLALEIQVPA